MTTEEPNKQMGQHWLRDDATLNAIVDAGQVEGGETVLEIGPGQGSLTDVLLERGAVITAVEFDANLARDLAKKYQNQSPVTVINQDIRRFNFSALPAGYKIIANIPYYLTSLLLRQLSETINAPQIAVLLVQKEVAQRVTAGPGEMSALSVITQMYFECNLGRIVKADLFIPPPKIDSQILILKRRPEPLFGQQNPKDLFRIVKAGFSERRKKLRSSLSGGLGISKAEAEVLLAKTGIDSNLRAQNLSLDEWMALSGQADKSR